MIRGQGCMIHQGISLCIRVYNSSLHKGYETDTWDVPVGKA